MDSAVAFTFTVLFLCELARPGTLTSRDTLAHMGRHELRRYLGFYLWYAVMYLAQLTVSLLLYLDVRNVKYNVEGRRRTIFVFLAFSPVLLVNLLLAAADVMYFPWAPLGLLYVMHVLFVAPYWLYAFRYYHWLGDGELVLFETPLVGMGRDPGPSTSMASTSRFAASAASAAPALEEVAACARCDPDPTASGRRSDRSVAVARLVSISDVE